MIELGAYMRAEELPTLGKTKWFRVYSKRSNAVLGQIKWYGAWRCYVFFPEPKTIFNGSCLIEIVGFLDGLMRERRAS